MSENALDGALYALIRTLPARAALPVVQRVDGWMNDVTALGTYADKVMSTAPAPFMHGLPDDWLSSMFHSDWIVRKAVSKRPDEALRLGMRITMPAEAGGSTTATKIQDALDDLEAVGAFREACTWENLYGGAVIFMGLDDGRTGLDSQAQPVAWTRLRRVLWLRVVDRRRIWPSVHEVDTDPSSPHLGQPTHYLLWDQRTGRNLRVHRDRLIVFPGVATSDEVRQRRNGWGISAIDPMFEAIQRNVTAWQSAGNAVANAQYVVYRLKGLGAMMGMPDGEAKMRMRARAMEFAKSVINAILIDADDGYTRENPSFGNMPEMLRSFMHDVAAALDMPVTVMWGQSPAGMNATGESDLENWHASVDSYREHHLRPRFHQLVTVLLASREGPTGGKVADGWRVVFPPLKTLSDLERAETRLKMSQADASDIEAGVLLAHEVARSRYRPEGYSLETQIDMELRERLREVESSPVGSGG